MSNKKGFVFIETIITIVVLSVALLYIYSNFNNVLIKEKTRIHYDDVAYIYRTNYVKEFFARYKLDTIVNELSDNNPMVIIGCDYENFFNEVNENQDDNNLENTTDESGLSMCNGLWNIFEIKSILVAKGDLSYIENCSDNSKKCSYLKNLSEEFITYLKTLGDLSEKNEYIMIIEYSHLIKENTNKYERNYSWVKI